MSRQYLKWSKKELDYLKNNYGKILLPALAKKLNRTYHATNQRCIILGLTKNQSKKQWMINQGKRKYNRNENYFDLSINKGDNLYWAGFVATDGCVDSYDLDIREKVLKFKLQNKDKAHVQKFMDALEFNAPIKQNKTDGGWLFSISSNKLCNDLEKYFNIVSTKTYILKPPKLYQKEDIKKFIIGCIDGDGCISKKNEKIGFSFISASEEFAVWVAQQLKWLSKRDKDIRIRVPKKRKNHHSDVYVFCVDGKDAIKLYKELMSVDCPRLERKWGPWKHLLEENNF